MNRAVLGHQSMSHTFSPQCSSSVTYTAGALVGTAAAIAAIAAIVVIIVVAADMLRLAMLWGK
jgi:hypothetical protein